MTSWWRVTLALLLCSVGAVVLGPGPAASAAPPASAGLGRVIADLGTVVAARPGFSYDGAYFAYLAPATNGCEVRVHDLRAQRTVSLTRTPVECYSAAVDWAAQADTLAWQEDAGGGRATELVWDAAAATVKAVASDAQVLLQSTRSGRRTLSADGRFLAFVGRSDAHPAPGADQSGDAWFVYDSSTGESLPLSRPDRSVEFGEWGPQDHRFVATTRAGTSGPSTGTCFGSGASCASFTGHEYFGDDGPDVGHWSPDGTAVLGFDQVAYDFTDDSMTPFPRGLDFVADPRFVGDDHVVGSATSGGFLWNLRTGAVTRTPVPPVESPNGRYLLLRDTRPDGYRYLNVQTGAVAPATFRGASSSRQPRGFWTVDGSSYLGVGPGGCSSLRQWSPATNTVSLFGPPGVRTCFAVPYPRVTSTWATSLRTFSSASGRFALVTKTRGTSTQDYVVDLRRHVLLGPLVGEAQGFAPARSEVLVVAKQPGGGTTPLLLVDPTPSPDVDDKPRWSAATPANGARVETEVGGQVRVQLGASDLQQTPVNLYFRWRTAAGAPVASPPKGWSCDRRRLAGGATVADCAFAPPKAYTAVRFLDVWAVNHVTGAQSDTRSYRIATGS